MKTLSGFSRAPDKAKQGGEREKECIVFASNLDLSFIKQFV
jgi:hypothetical protein